MRFSLLSLLALVTIAGIVINLGASYSKLRKAEVDLARVLAQTDALQAEAAHFRETTKQFRAFGDQKTRMLEARQSFLKQLEETFVSHVETESRVVPVEGKVSVRSIPTFERPRVVEKAYTIHVAEGRICQVRLEFEQDRGTFIGFKPQQTFELNTGFNQLVFQYLQGEQQFVAELRLNGEVLATANADPTDDRGYSQQSLHFEKQRDYGRTDKPQRLFEISPSPMYDGLEHEATITLSLLLGEENEK